MKLTQETVNYIQHWIRIGKKAKKDYVKLIQKMENKQGVNNGKIRRN